MRNEKPQAAALPQVILPTFDAGMLDAANRRLQQAQLCAINNDADYEACAMALKSDKAFVAITESGYRQHADALNTALRQIRAWWKPPGDIGNQACSIRSRLMGEYQQKKLNEQRRLQAAADERAAKERRALEQRAAKAEASGNLDKAAALAQQADMVAAPVIRTETPKVSGQSVREVWFFQITDASLIPREYLMPDEPKLGRVARAMKGTLEVPGVRFWSERRVASGAE